MQTRLVGPGRRTVSWVRVATRQVHNPHLEPRGRQLGTMLGTCQRRHPHTTANSLVLKRSRTEHSVRFRIADRCGDGRAMVNRPNRGGGPPATTGGFGFNRAPPEIFLVGLLPIELIKVGMEPERVA
jgi:hypothetical protein